MPRKQSTNSEEQTAPPTTSEQLAEIVELLHRMERRDRVRMTGSLIRSLLALIPLVVLLGSLWYFYTSGEEFMSELMDKTIQKSAEYSQESLLDQLEGHMQR